MIVSFSIENFRSFSTEQTLSMVASPRLATAHAEHTVAIPNSDERVLRGAVIYGANGAGKSNLFLALKYLKDIATETRQKTANLQRTPFQLSDDTNPNSSFDLQFIAAGELYRYGVIIDDATVREEWLVRVARGRESVLFERATDRGSTTVTLGASLITTNKLSALAIVGGPPNQSFLATVDATLDKEDIGAELNAVLAWFDRTLNTIGPDDMYGPLGHSLSEDASFLEFAGSFLKSSSTGIDHLEVSKRELSEEELRSRIPERILTDILSTENADAGNGLLLVKARDGQEILMDLRDEKHFYQLTISSSHMNSSGKIINFPLDEESDGTRRLLDLVPTLHRYQSGGGVFMIDEIDRSLHPILVHKFLEFFFKSCVGHNQQIIVTTHESSLLDLSLLRRDEIWFTEKDKLSASHIYSLKDFKVRNDLEIRKHYLQGRFGGIPFLGNVDRLMNTREEPSDAKA